MHWPGTGDACSMADASHIALIRHGAYRQRAGAPSARQPYPLTDAGIAQARAGAETLSGMIADHGMQPAPIIFSSRQLRAWQTAREILTRLRELGHPVEGIEETSALAERGLGSAANLTVAEIEAILRDDPRHDPPPPGWKSDSDYRLPLEGAESLTEAGQRVARHLVDTARPGQLTIHVGHGASFRHACCHLGLIDRTEIPKLSMFHARPSLICHDSHGRWRHLAGAWKIRAPEEDPKD